MKLSIAESGHLYFYLEGILLYFLQTISFSFAKLAGLNDIGMRHVEDLGVYLGMPLLHKRVTMNHFDFFVSKVCDVVMSSAEWDWCRMGLVSIAKFSSR
ncbi:hypothetical protein J1N35_034584 [Gossypium stocksii]|uniref:Uncharacterized protein n=1 Tax=Gossypium stocksii TaxID=47602 RepID=A0A9D3UT60_9ROSI|nr:hypothetical protein J1N35_034584 [Gossypium stocksii]